MNKKDRLFLKKSTLRNEVDWNFEKYVPAYSNSKIARIAERNLKSYKRNIPDPSQYINLFHNEYHRLWLILNQVQQLPEAARLEKAEYPEVYRTMMDKFNYDRMGDAITKAFDNFMGPGQLSTNIAYSFLNDIINEQMRSGVNIDGDDRIIIVDQRSNSYSVSKLKDVAESIGIETDDVGDLVSDLIVKKGGRVSKGTFIFKYPEDKMKLQKLTRVARSDNSMDLFKSAIDEFNFGDEDDDDEGELIGSELPIKEEESKKEESKKEESKKEESKK